MCEKFLKLMALTLVLFAVVACGSCCPSYCPNCFWDFEQGYVPDATETSAHHDLNGIWESDRGGVIEIIGNRIIEHEVWVLHFTQDILPYTDLEEQAQWMQKLREITEDTFPAFIYDIYANYVQPPNVRPYIREHSGLVHYHVQALVEPAQGTFILTDDDRIEIIWDNHIEWQYGEMVEVSRGILVYSFDRTENTIQFGFAGTGSATMLSGVRFIRVME